jgi:LAO/AO transport system kinase
MAGFDITNLRTLSRAISQVENGVGNYQELVRESYAKGNWPSVVGITGPPGAGKSTLIDALAALWGMEGSRIAILAIDPSSPFSGGAVLGDRIRMDRSDHLPNVFFRSLSARGHVGGLNEATCDIIALLSGFGFERILLETVGAGQSDIEVAGMVDCTVVVAVPGLGDSVQALKAGIMEIGDVYTVNKSDLPGAETTRQQMESMIGVAYATQDDSGPRHSSPPPPSTPGVQALKRRHGDAWTEPSVWRPPVLAVSAGSDQGIKKLGEAIDGFIEWCGQSDRLRRKRTLRVRDQLLSQITRRVLQPYLHDDGEDGDAIPAGLASWVDAIVSGNAIPGEAVEAILSERLATGSPSTFDQDNGVVLVQE